MHHHLARRQLAAMLTVLAVAVHGSAASAVQLSISSAQVAQPGGPAQLCVSLFTGGEEVAGTQNDLVWDGTCMTLNDNACFASGSHGKQVNTRIQNSSDFRMRVLVLSLSDVDPIDDGVLYCCNVQGEAPPGSCCSISVVNTGASDSKGNAVGGVGGNSGSLCTQGNSGGAVGSVAGAGSQMGMNSGGNSGGSMGSGGSGSAMGGSGSMGGSAAQAPPANQVLQGGGAAAPAAPAAPAGNPAQPVVVAQGGGSGAQEPTPFAAPATPEAPARAVVPAAPAPAVAPAAAPAGVPATAAATAAVTAPAPSTPADTPAAAVPTAVPPTKAPPSTATAPRATATAKRGWFGCQIDDAASSGPPLAFALVFAALAYARRRRAPHR